uniref:Protein kinase domain-containing protein n=1 Tax=Caenorhabditis tropicalis TaxID=1561998 RepID=A0A1I7SYI9_9PELO
MDESDEFQRWSVGVMAYSCLYLVVLESGDVDVVRNILVNDAILDRPSERRKEVLCTEDGPPWQDDGPLLFK